MGLENPFKLRGFSNNMNKPENKHTIEVTGKAVNLGVSKGMQIPFILKFEWTRNCIDILKKNLPNL